MGSVKPTVLTSSMLVPASVVIAAVTITVGVCRWTFGNAAEQAALKVQVESIDDRVKRAENRLDKSDERWDLIREDLGKIKERLGIVEAKAPPK